MNTQIFTNVPLEAVGRNGRMKQIGLNIADCDGIIHIAPINTQCVGNCEIQINTQLAKQLIPILCKQLCPSSICHR